MCHRAAQATAVGAETEPVTHLETLDLPALRAERARLAGEAARLVWLRRLVLARRDLEVAQLTGAGAGLWEVDGLAASVRDALGHVPTRGCPELLTDLAQAVRTLTRAAHGAQGDLDAATEELVRRYHDQPDLCLRGSASAVLV